MALLIRRAHGADAEPLLELICAHALFEGSAASCDLASVEQALNSDGHRLLIWVAECDGLTVGYASATIDFSTWQMRTFVTLDCLFVDASSRAQGVGRKLMAAVIAFARDKDIQSMEWQTPDWNEKAMRFYATLGGSAKQKVRYTLDIGPADAGETALIA